MTAIVDLDPTTAETLHAALGAGQPGAAVPGRPAPAPRDAVRRGRRRPRPEVDLSSALALAESMRVIRPSLAVILVRRRVDTVRAHRRPARGRLRGRRGARPRRAHHRLSRAPVSSPAGCARPSAGACAERRAGTTAARSITVFSAKGGCGKTTLATNLAAALADRGRREVCLVDLDLAFGDVAIALQLFPAHTIADAVPLADSLDASGGRVAAHPALARADDPRRADRAGHRRVDPGDAGRRPCSTLLKQQFDFVVVDTPAGVRRPRARRVRPERRGGPARHARHPGAEEPQAHPRDARPAQLPARPLAPRAQPGRLEGRARAERGREDPQGADLGADPELARRPGVDQPRRADRARRPQAPGAAQAIKAVRRATTSPPARRPARRHPDRAAHRPARPAAQEGKTT